MGIPRIVHQTWKTETLPANCEAMARSWRSCNPGWEWRLWTDADNDALLRGAEPALQKAVAACRYEIQKLDILRWLYLREFGGVYADLDSECLVPLDEAFVAASLVLAQEPDEHARRHGQRRLLTNAFLASTRAHEFTRAVLAGLSAEALGCCVTHDDVLTTTGPIFVTRIHDSRQPPAAVVWPAARVSPYRHGDPRLLALERTPGVPTPDRTRLRAAGTVCVHYWHNSWVDRLAGEPLPFDPAQIGDFVFHPGWDSRGHDLYNAGRDMLEVARRCREDPRAVGFNTDGFVKGWIAPRLLWQRRSFDPAAGIFVARDWNSIASMGARLRRLTGKN